MNFKFQNFGRGTFKSFFVFNMKRQMTLLSSGVGSKRIGLLNNLQKRNYISILGSSSLRGSVTFLMNGGLSNSGLSIVSNKMRSDLLTILEEIVRLDQNLIENGR